MLLHAGQFVGGTICLKVSLSPKYEYIISNERGKVKNFFSESGIK